MSPSPRWLALALLSSLAPGARAEPDAGAPARTAPSSAPSPATPEAPLPLGPRPRPDGGVQASVADEDLARWNVGGSSDPAFPGNRPGFHVAPRVKVDTVVRAKRMPEQSSRKGVLSKLGVLAQARNRGYWPFRLCFEAGLRGDAALKGKTHVRITVGRDGRVSAARLLATELRRPDVATCLVSRSRALHFAPGPPRRTDVDTTIDLSPGDAPLPVIDTAGSSSAPGPGTIDAGALASALGAALPAIAACFAGGTARDPTLWGRLGLRVDLGADGAVRRVEQLDSRFPDREVAACTLSVVQGLALPPPSGGASGFTWGVRLGAPPQATPPGAAGIPLPGGPRN
jgi:hypothetical protein